MNRPFLSRPAGRLAAPTRKRFVSCLPACGWVLGWLLASILGCGLLAGATPARATPPPKALVIVAPRQLHSALAEFVQHKQRLLPTELAALETVLEQSAGVDAPERLKRFLYRAWRERHLGYVLLVGDGDVMPMRYMVLDRVTAPAFDYAFYPSDLYYSDLAGPDGQFDDWNGNKEGFHAGYFGEVRGEKNKHDPINFDRVDYRPDIAVGRWPTSTLEGVRRVAAKTIAFESALLAGRSPTARNVALFAVGGWVDARPIMERLAGKLSGSWTVEKRYYTDSPQAATTPPPSAEELAKLLNAGLGLVCHAGHGTDDSWEQCFSVAQIQHLRNADRLPVMISAGCSTARLATLPPYEGYVDIAGNEHAGTNNKEVFTSPPPPPACYQQGTHLPSGLGKQLVCGSPNGAVAYIGCNTGSQPCGLTLLEGFVVALQADSDPRLGDCWARAVSYYYDHERLAVLTPNSDWYPPSIFFQGMKFMLFGDPSLQLAAPAAASG